MKGYVYVSVLSLCLGLCACSPPLPEDVATSYQDIPDRLDYNMHVKPILSDKCFKCHGPDTTKQKAGLRLDLKEVAFAELSESPGKVAIDPGDLTGSEMFHRILSIDPDYQMPPPESHLSLTAKEKATLIKWIEEGAVYKPHWAFVKPDQQEAPETKFDELAINEIDQFIFKKLEQEKLQPSREADKELLLRRVTLDLTGLPPTIMEIDAFMQDNSTAAYENQVDRLASEPALWREDGGRLA